VKVAFIKKMELPEGTCKSILLYLDSLPLNIPESLMDDRNFESEIQGDNPDVFMLIESRAPRVVNPAAILYKSLRPSIALRPQPNNAKIGQSHCHHGQ
jgi:hypothetical protein